MLGASKLSMALWYACWARVYQAARRLVGLRQHSYGFLQAQHGETVRSAYTHERSIQRGSLAARASDPTSRTTNSPPPGESSSEDSSPPRSVTDGNGNGNGSGNGADSSLSGSTSSLRSESLSGGETASIVPSESSGDERSMTSSEESIDYKSDDKKTVSPRI